MVSGTSNTSTASAADDTAGAADDDCRDLTAATPFRRVDRLPFDRLPAQSRLFLDYLRDPAALRGFYPNAVRHHHELVARAPGTLAAYETDRGDLCDALARMNTEWGASEKTLGNIERLRADDAVAVVTGQQIGLFTGPLYTIYKALTAVRIAACLDARGTIAVPVFWMASEDHDWMEVQTAEVIACDGRLAAIEAADDLHTDGRAVGEVILDDSIGSAVARLFDVLPTTEFTPELRRVVEAAYAPGHSYTGAFARLLTYLTTRFGLVLLDPLDAELKRLAAPMYARAAGRAPQLAHALAARSRELVEAGYHAQVLAAEDAFPLFLHGADADTQTPGETNGERQALVRTADGRYRVKGARPAKGTRGNRPPAEDWSAEELAAWAEREPARFSPNVTLRAVVQDYLLPTVAYIGGAAELSYFAQIAEAYRVLDRPATPVLARASLTIVEPRSARTLERFHLELADLFDGFDRVSRRVVEEQLGRAGAERFDDTETSISAALDRLRPELARVDPTLAGALDTARGKIDYQLQALRTRFVRAEMQRHRAAHRQLERLFTILLPEGTLQERRVNVLSLLARHGDYCLGWIHDQIDLAATDHHIVYL